MKSVEQIKKEIESLKRTWEKKTDGYMSTLDKRIAARLDAKINALQWVIE